MALALVCLVCPPPVAAAQGQPTQPGETLFAARCGFCHGRDAAGGETGPDLTRSTLVRDDVDGDKLIPVIRDGRVNTGMPAFELGATDLKLLVSFIHVRRNDSEAKPGRRRGVDLEDLRTGSVDAGRTYFNGTGGCARCL